MSVNNLTPPSALGDEAAILGSCMMFDDVLHYCISNMEANLFAIDLHQDIFIAIKNLFEKSSKPDALAVVRELKSMGKAGNAYEVTKLLDSATTFDIEGKVLYVKQAYARRNIFETAKVIQESSFDETIELDQLIGMATSFEEDLINTFSGNAEKGIGEQVDDAMNVIKDRCDKASRGELVGMPTQLQSVNNIIGGVEPGQMIVIAARPGDGKTSYMLDLSMFMSDQGLYPALFSLEMSDCQLIHRLMIADSGVDYYRFQAGKLKSYRHG